MSSLRFTWNRSILCALFTVLFLAGCAIKKQNSLKGLIAPNEFVFIEYFSTQEGEVILGTAPRGMRIDGPTYRFDENTKQLNIRRKDNLSIDSVMVLLGNGKILKGAIGSGISFRLTNIKALPFTDNQISIDKITKSKLYFRFGKQKFSIDTGCEWQSEPSIKIDTIKMDEPSIIRIKSTYTIRYHGILNKKLVTGI